MCHWITQLFRRIAGFLKRYPNLWSLWLILLIMLIQLAAHHLSFPAPVSQSSAKFSGQIQTKAVPDVAKIAATDQTQNHQGAKNHHDTCLPSKVPNEANTEQCLPLAASTDDSELLPPQIRGENQTERQGKFRVGNQTTYPLRIALRINLPIMKQRREKRDVEPVHWDFAPGEGGQSGLLLAVAEGDLYLRPGDILVAFAQDGSGRYWGPYAVDQTQLPYWNAERHEWQLLIQPYS